MTENQRDITRTFFAVLFIGALLGTSLWILKPFLGAAIWSVTIVTATWPLMVSIQGRLWGRRSLAVAVMTMVLLCLLVVPLWLSIDTIVSNEHRITSFVKSLSTFEVRLRRPGLALYRSSARTWWRHGRSLRQRAYRISCKNWPHTAATPSDGSSRK